MCHMESNRIVLFCLCSKFGNRVWHVTQNFCFTSHSLDTTQSIYICNIWQCFAERFTFFRQSSFFIAQVLRCHFLATLFCSSLFGRYTIFLFVCCIGLQIPKIYHFVLSVRIYYTTIYTVFPHSTLHIYDDETMKSRYVASSRSCYSFALYIYRHVISILTLHMYFA